MVESEEMPYITVWQLLSTEDNNVLASSKNTESDFSKASEMMFPV